MRQIGFLLDPALLVWDAKDYDKKKSEYLDVIEYVINILDLMEDGRLASCHYPASTSSLVLEHCPFDFCLYNDPDFRDFVVRISILLSNPREEIENDPNFEKININPNLFQRSWFAPELQLNIQKLLCNQECSSHYNAIISHNFFINTASSTLEIGIGDENVAIPLYVSAGQINLAIKNFSPTYELHEKHHPIYGYSNRLPLDLTEKQLQSYLDESSELNTDRVYGVYSKKIDKYIIFRQHHLNKFHAYLVSEEELSRMCVSKGRFPIVE